MNRMLVICAVLCVAVAAAVAQDKPVPGFKSSLSAGVSLAGGNSETIQANAALATEGEKIGLGSVRAGVDGNYGESTIADKTDTTVKNAHAFANVKKTISPITFGCLDASVLYDDMAKIDYRAILGPGLGFYILKEDHRWKSLSVEAGASYLWKKEAGTVDSYIAFRAAERCVYMLGEQAKLSQSVDYLPKAEDLSDYLLTAELCAEAAMTSTLNLKISLQDKYNSMPGAGLKNNDLTLIAGISVSL